MKKKMYYNMRVCTAQRNLAETQLRLLEKKKTLMQVPEERIKTLSRTLKSVSTVHKITIVPLLKILDEFLFYYPQDAHAGIIFIYICLRFLA